MGGNTGLSEGRDTGKSEGSRWVSGYRLENLIGILVLDGIGGVESVWEIVLFVHDEIGGGWIRCERDGCSGRIPDERWDIGDVGGGSTQELEVSGIVPVDSGLSWDGCVGLWDKLLPYFRGGWVG